LQVTRSFLPEWDELYKIYCIGDKHYNEIKNKEKPPIR
jgi:hypothetical protein